MHALSAQQAQQAQQSHRESPTIDNHGHPSPSTSNDASERDASMVGQINTTMQCDQTFNKRSYDCHDPCETASAVISPPLSFQTTQPTNSDELMSLSDASVLFYRYMRLMAPSMPFVVIPDGTDPWELAEEKPFLLQVITTVAYFHDLPKQQVMVKDLMRKISEKLLMRNEKSLEVLQGILVLIAW